jgi:hypothetical protein
VIRDVLDIRESRMEYDLYARRLDIQTLDNRKLSIRNNVVRGEYASQARCIVIDVDVPPALVCVRTCVRMITSTFPDQDAILRVHECYRRCQGRNARTNITNGRPRSFLLQEIHRCVRDSTLDYVRFFNVMYHYRVYAQPIIVRISSITRSECHSADQKVVEVEEDTAVVLLKLPFLYPQKTCIMYTRV